MLKRRKKQKSTTLSSTSSCCSSSNDGELFPSSSASSSTSSPFCFSSSSSMTLGKMSSSFPLMFTLLFVMMMMSSLPTALGRCLDKCFCSYDDLKVNCTRAGLKSVPITFNPRLQEYTIRENDLSNLGVSRPFEAYTLLVNLDLSLNRLREIPAHTFQNQKQLKVLNLSANRISSLSKESFKGLQSLEELVLTNNSLSNISSPLFFDLKRLERLHLQQNNISSTSEDSLNGLTSLKFLSLRDNKLGLEVNPSSQSYSIFASIPSARHVYSDSRPVNLLSIEGLKSSILPNLTILDIGRNAFSGILHKFSPFAFDESSPETSSWGKLAELKLDGCFIEFIEGSSFSGLISLSILRIHDNSLTDVPTDVWKYLPNLQELEMGGNPIQRIEEDAFALQHLRSLDLKGSLSLQSISAGAFRRCPSLEKLILSHNPLLVLGDEHIFEGLGNLQVLDLSHNKMLQYLNPDLFAPLKNLRFLSLRSSRLAMIDSRIGSFVVNLQLLDVRDNPLMCNCSVLWMRNHFLSSRNDSSFSSSPSPSLSMSDAVRDAVTSRLSQGNYKDLQTPAESSLPSSTSPAPSSPSSPSFNPPEAAPYFLRQQWSLDPSSPGSASYHNQLHLILQENSGQNLLSPEQMFYQSLLEARCFEPASLKGKRIVDLGPDVISCTKDSVMTPTVIGGIVGGFILCVLLVITVHFRSKFVACIRCREKRIKRPQDLTHSAFLPTSIAVSSTKFNPAHHPVSTMQSNNNRKVYSFDPPPLATLGGVRGMPYENLGSLRNNSRNKRPEFVYVQHNKTPDSLTTLVNGRGSRNISTLSNGFHPPPPPSRRGVDDGYFEPIYRHRHGLNTINDLNNPYEVVPIIPPPVTTLPYSSSSSSSSSVHPSSSSLRTWNMSHNDHRTHLVSDRHQLPPHQQHQLQQQQTQQLLHPLDPEDPMFNFYEEADFPPYHHHSTPSTEL